MTSRFTMSVTFTTQTPAALLKAFDERIAQSDPNGKITTWERHADGVHYTHRAVDWRNKAFFRASAQTGKLVFDIVKPTTSTIAATVYGYYHGHLIETFLNHFDRDFVDGSASALPALGDLCG